MKIHAKKKAYQQAMKKLAKDGYAPKADGTMVRRSALQDNSMKRDFYPQSTI